MATEFKNMQARRGSSATASSNNPTLLSGQFGYNTDAKRFKLGDGITTWNSLQWAAPQVLTPTAVKTATYTAVVGDLVRVDCTSAGVTINLPAAPLDASQIGVIKIDSTSNTVTIARAGTDVFQAAGGATSLTLPGTNRSNAFTAVILQYDAAGGIWLPISGWATPTAGTGGSSIITGRGTFASRPASGTNTGDLYDCTDIGNTYRWNGSSWDITRGGVLTAFTPPTSSGWTALNSGSITAALDSRVMSLASSSGENWKGEIRTLSPTSNYTATFYFDWATPTIEKNGSGIILKNSGGNQIITYGPYYETASGWVLRSIKWTSVTVYSADYLSKSVNPMPNWLRVRDDNTTRFLEYSYNGIDWVLHHSVGRTDFITPNQIAWGSNANNTGGSYTVTTRLRHLSGV